MIFNYGAKTRCKIKAFDREIEVGSNTLEKAKCVKDYENDQA